MGIPIVHHSSPAKSLGKLLGKARRVVEALHADDTPPLAPLLRLRFVHSLVVASIDFVLSGVFLRPVHVAGTGYARRLVSAWWP